MALNLKQKMFCEEYMIDFNGAAAAVRAGYSEKTANRISSHQLTKVDIKEYIHKRLKEKEIYTQVTQERVLLEIARLAFRDLRNAYDKNGNYLPVHELPDEIAASVSSIKTIETIDENGNRKTVISDLKFFDKGKQIDLACRHLGMLTDKLQIDVTDNLADRLARARLRAD